MNIISIEDIKSKARASLSGRYIVGVRLALFYLITISITGSLPLLVSDENLIQEIIYLLVCYFVTVIDTFVSISIAAPFLLLCSGDDLSTFTNFFNNIREKNSIGKNAAFIALIQSIPSFVIFVLLNFVPGFTAINIKYKLIILAIYMIVFLAIKALLVPMYFLVHDVDETSPSMLLNLSLWMFKKSDGLIFRLWLSFIPLIFYGICSFGIGFLFLYPYFYCCNAHYYLALSKSLSTDN